jgi:hypothetical protein
MSSIERGSRVYVPVDSLKNPERELGTVQEVIEIEGTVRGYTVELDSSKHYSVQPDAVGHWLVYTVDECELVETPASDSPEVCS